MTRERAAPMSWGRYPRLAQRVVRMPDRHAALPLPEEGSVLPYGLGRSYGDSCLNGGGTLILGAGDNVIAATPLPGTYDAARARFETRLPLAWFPGHEQSGLYVGIILGGVGGGCRGVLGV